ncbi:unnamed protein product [Adineta ricciae]|uniref:Uncharacterized protein n=1 Tax=Adineta ricciae TaxID=249248 RepID=A0A814JH84_ADIRI|nr:unnamed protein product [Adineta ricciae]
MGGNNFTIAILFVLCILVNCVTSDKEVNFDSAYGLTVRSISKVDDQLYDVIVSSNEVLNDQTIRILLPLDYTTSDRTRRYPALYLLHGSFGGAEDWTRAGNAQNICGNASLITVMPNGDPFGFYTNWVIPGNAAPQNWRTFHMEQLVPWIDFNLRTVTSKQGRAIAGLSMGGFGAIHYAEFYSHNFIYAASFSGALDLLNTNVQNGILNLRIIDDVPLVGPVSIYRAYMAITINDMKNELRLAQEELASQIVLSLTYFAHSTSFYMYTLSGTIFRKTLMKLFER